MRRRQDAPRRQRLDRRQVLQGRLEVRDIRRFPRSSRQPRDRRRLHRDARPLARLHLRRGDEARQGRILREAPYVLDRRGEEGHRRAEEVRPRLPDRLNAAFVARLPHSGLARARRSDRDCPLRRRELRQGRPEARRAFPPRPLLRRSPERSEGERGLRASRREGLGHVARAGEVAPLLQPARARRRQQVLSDVLALRRRHRLGLQRRLGRASPRHRAVGPRHGRLGSVQGDPLRGAVL